MADKQKDAILRQLFCLCAIFPFQAAPSRTAAGVPVTTKGRPPLRRLFLESETHQAQNFGLGKMSTLRGIVHSAPIACMASPFLTIQAGGRPSQSTVGPESFLS